MKKIFPVHHNVLEFLTFPEIHNLSCVKKGMTEYINENPLIKKKINKSLKIIQNFIKYCHSLFLISKQLDNDLLYNMNPNSLIYNKYKFYSVILLYMKEYTKSNANQWIKGNNVPLKTNIIKNYIDFDIEKSYNKYDLYKLLTQMNINDIFFIGF